MQWRFKTLAYLLGLIFIAFLGYAQEQTVRLEFSGNNAEANRITLMGAGFGQYPQASVDFGVIPTDNAFPGATDGQGAIVTANPGEGVMIFGPNILLPTAAMIRCSVRSTASRVSVILAAIDLGENVFVMTNTPTNGTYFLNRYRRLTGFFVPPSTGFQPLIQVFNSQPLRPPVSSSLRRSFLVVCRLSRKNLCCGRSLHRHSAHKSPSSRSFCTKTVSFPSMRSQPIS